MHAASILLSIPLQQTSRCKDMSYSASTETALCLTRSMPPVFSPRLSLCLSQFLPRSSTRFRRLRSRPAFRGVDNDGERIRLQARRSNCCVMLLERPGQLVTREEICQKIWSTDTFSPSHHGIAAADSKEVQLLSLSCRARHATHTCSDRCRLVKVHLRRGLCQAVLARVQFGPAGRFG